jgi:hypothetical protein
VEISYFFSFQIGAILAVRKSLSTASMPVWAYRFVRFEAHEG